MKKVVLTVVTLTFVAIAAQAQSPRVEVMMTSPALNGASSKPTRSVSRPQQRQTALERIVLQRVEQAKQAAPQAVTQAAPVRTAQTPAKPAASKPQTRTARISANEGSVGQWLKAIFLGGRFPGESANAYHDRLAIQSHPSALPFK